MPNFSLHESLLKLQEKNYDKNISETVKFLTDNYDEFQLRMLSQNQGLKIDNNIIRLYFINNVGFRCINEKDNIYGKLPLCGNIERYMNNIYSNFVSEEIDRQLNL
jgi:hypothetical protein